MKSSSGFCRLPDDFTGLAHVILMGIAAASFHCEEFGKLLIHASHGGFRLRILRGAGAQDINLFKFFQPVAELFKPQGTEVAGINQVAVSRRPVAEVRFSNGLRFQEL